MIQEAAVKEDSWKGLLGLIFLTLAVESGVDKPVFINFERKTFHQLFFQLQQDYGEAFPTLGHVHFVTAGAFPYCQELQEYMEEAEYLVLMPSNEAMIDIRHTGQEMSEVALLCAQANYQSKKAELDQMIERLRKLVTFPKSMRARS